MRDAAWTANAALRLLPSPCVIVSRCCCVPESTLVSKDPLDCSKTIMLDDGRGEAPSSDTLDSDLSNHVVRHCSCPRRSPRVISTPCTVRRAPSFASRCMRGCGAVRLLPFLQVKFYDAFHDAELARVGIVMEYMGGGSLQDLVDAGGCQDENHLARMSAHVLKVCRRPCPFSCSVCVLLSLPRVPFPLCLLRVSTPLTPLPLIIIIIVINIISSSSSSSSLSHTFILSRTRSIVLPAPFL